VWEIELYSWETRRPAQRVKKWLRRRFSQRPYEQEARQPTAHLRSNSSIKPDRVPIYRGTCHGGHVIRFVVNHSSELSECSSVHPFHRIFRARA
jgi:hypothetical protein